MYLLTIEKIAKFKGGVIAHLDLSKKVRLALWYPRVM